MSNDDSDEPRTLSLLLLLGILVLPVIFAWFVFRRGYSNTLRTGVFLYLGLTILVGLARAF